MAKTSDAIKVAIITLIGTIAVAFIAIIPNLLAEEKPPAPAPSEHTDTADEIKDDATTKHSTDTFLLPLNQPPESVENAPTPPSAVPAPASGSNDASRSAPTTFKTEIKGNNNGAIIQGESIKVGTLNFAPPKDSIK